MQRLQQRASSATPSAGDARGALAASTSAAQAIDKAITFWKHFDTPEPAPPSPIWKRSPAASARIAPASVKVSTAVRAAFGARSEVMESIAFFREQGRWGSRPAEDALREIDGELLKAIDRLIEFCRSRRGRAQATILQLQTCAANRRGTERIRDHRRPDPACSPAPSSMRLHPGPRRSGRAATSSADSATCSSASRPISPADRDDAAPGARAQGGDEDRLRQGFGRAQQPAQRRAADGRGPVLDQAGTKVVAGGVSVGAERSLSE